jgi:predicted nucleic acid-binding protein
MTLMDAYGLVALVADEPAADEVERILREGGSRVVAVNLAEAIDICRRSHGLSQDETRAAFEPLTLSGTLAVAISGEAEAWLAADLRTSHYHRQQRPLSMADCFLLAHAVAAGEALATSDPDLAEVARIEDVTVVALPDRAGRRP